MEIDIATRNSGAPSRLALALAIGLALALVLAQVAPAQMVFGIIRGAVADTTGAAVVGAKITVLNVNTREKRTANSDEAGNFVFPALIPGPYRLTVEAAGFKLYEKTGVNLTTSERLDVGRVSMQLGAVTETVEVNATPTPVQTASAERSTIVTGQQVGELPILSRNVSMYLRMVPGAVDSGDSFAWQVDPTAPMPSVGGMDGKTTGLSLDGVGMNEGDSPYPNGHVNPDALAEVKVLVNNYAAEYGHTGGAVVNMVTKGGSQAFHGSLYTFLRHEQYNATNFFDNLVGNKKPKDRYHMYGGSIGGPVYWPGKFNTNKDKLFFFFSDERTRYVAGNSGQWTMPTELERGGDFSQTLDSAGKMPVIKDPLNNGAPFAGNKIPAGRINPATQKLLTIFPMPNFFDRAVSQGNFNFKTGNLPVYWKYDEAIARIDYNASSKARLYWRGNYFTRQQHLSGQGNSQWPIWTGVYMTDDYRLLGGVLSMTYAFSPTLVNEFSFGAKGHARLCDEIDTEAVQKYSRTKLGLNIPQFNPQLNPYNIAPQMSFGGVPGAAGLNYDGRWPMQAGQNQWVVTDGISKVWRSHTLKAGIEWIAYFMHNGDSGNFAGSFNFGQDVNNPLDANWAYANALLGNFSSYSESTARPRQYDYTRSVEFYVQDNWRASRKLTFDYGMRFAVRWPDWNPVGLAASFDPARFSASQQVTLYRPVLDSAGKRVAQNPLTGQLLPAVFIGGIVPNSGNFTNGMVRGSDPNYPRGFMQNRGIQPMPRFGFAYDLFGNGKTAIRGGFGMSTYAAGDSQIMGLAGNPPIVFTPILYYNSVPDFINASTSLFPMNVSGNSPTGENPTYYNFSFGVQRSIGAGFVVDAAYVGTLGRQLWVNQNLNTLPYGARFLPQNLDSTTGRVLPDAFLRPYVGYGNVNVRQIGGTSNYNAMQLQAHRRFSKGLEADVVYAWSKSMDYGGSFPVYMPRSWNYGMSSLDRTHNLKVAWVWQLPKVNGLINSKVAWALFDGWQITGMASFISGAPSGVGFSLSDGADLTGGGDGQRIVQISDAVLPKGERTFYQYFNTSVFARPAKGSTGSAGRVVFRGPGVNNWDIGLKRTFKIKEAARVEFRMDAYNAFNQTQFSGVDSSARFDANGNQINGQFGRLTSARPPRRMQATVRISF